MRVGNRQLLKLGLKATAKLAGVDVPRAVRTIRHNPLLGEEVHIQESLVNLEEALAAYRAAGDSLRRYPSMQRHSLREQRHILNHCVGALFRIIEGDKAAQPAYSYSQDETSRSLRRLIQLIVAEARRVGRPIDADILEIIQPFLSWRQKLSLRRGADWPGSRRLALSRQFR